MFFVLFVALGVDHNTVDKDHNKTVQEKFEDTTYLIPKCCQGICKPKQHNSKLIMATVLHRLVHILRFDRN